MSKRYSPARKQEALSLLKLYDCNVPTVQCLTDIPASTLYDWRKQHLNNNPELVGQKMFNLREISDKQQNQPKILTKQMPNSINLPRQCPNQPPFRTRRPRIQSIPSTSTNSKIPRSRAKPPANTSTECTRSN